MPGTTIRYSPGVVRLLIDVISFCAFAERVWVVPSVVKLDQLPRASKLSWPTARPRRPQ